MLAHKRTAKAACSSFSHSCFTLQADSDPVEAVGSWPSLSRRRKLACRAGSDEGRPWEAKPPRHGLPTARLSPRQARQTGQAGEAVDQTASKASLQSRRRLGARQGLRSSLLEEQAIPKHPWQASPDRHAKRDAGSPSPSEPSHTHLWARWSRRSSLLEEPRPSQTIQAGNSLPGTRQRAAYGAPSHTPTVPIRRQRSCLSCGSWLRRKWVTIPPTADHGQSAANPPPSVMRQANAAEPPPSVLRFALCASLLAPYASRFPLPPYRLPLPPIPVRTFLRSYVLPFCGPPSHRPTFSRLRLSD